MLIPNLLKYQIPFTFQLLVVSPNLLKSQIPFTVGEGGARTQLSTFHAESKSAKIPNSLYGVRGGGRGLGPNFQLLMLSPNLLKSQIPFMVGWGWLGGGMAPNFHLLMLSANLLKLQIPFMVGGGWRVGAGDSTSAQWNTWNLVLPPSVHLGWTNKFCQEYLQLPFSVCITVVSLRKLKKQLTCCTALCQASTLHSGPNWSEKRLHSLRVSKSCTHLSIAAKNRTLRTAVEKRFK